MFEFLKRLVGPAPVRVPARAPARASSRSQRKPAPRRPRPRDEALDGPVSTVEVVEGNSEQDWALWEDSVAIMDSQTQGLTARASQYDSLSPSSSGDIDAFASVRKRDR